MNCLLITILGLTLVLTCTKPMLNAQHVDAPPKRFIDPKNPVFVIGATPSVLVVSKKTHLKVFHEMVDSQTDGSALLFKGTKNERKIKLVGITRLDLLKEIHKIYNEKEFFVLMDNFRSHAVHIEKEGKFSVLYFEDSVDSITLEQVVKADETSSIRISYADIEGEISINSPSAGLMSKLMLRLGCTVKISQITK